MLVLPNDLLQRAAHLCLSCVAPVAHWHRLCSAPECAASASQNRPAQRLPVANSYLLETPRGTAAIKKLQIAALIGDLSRKADILTADIEHEEIRSGVRDLADPAYPVLARSLRVRRENIKTTIASLEALVQGHPRRPKWPSENCLKLTSGNHVR
jgi:hypothetical protein